MTFKEAENRLQSLAIGRFFSITYEKTTYSSGEVRTDCRLYIDGPGWFNGNTFDAAFISLEGKIQEPPDGDEAVDVARDAIANAEREAKKEKANAEI